MFSYFGDHTSQILGYLWTHTYLSVLPVVIGLVIAVPIGALASRFRWSYPPIVGIAGILYTIPSLVMFVVLPGILHNSIISVVNVVVALTVYAVALLVRVVADGLNSVSPETKQAATAMGYTGRGRFFAVELPLAVPVVAAGVRVAVVSNVSLVSVATLIGTAQLGTLFSAFQELKDPYPPIWIGIILSVLLALVLDLIVVLASRTLTPWRRAGARA